MLRDRPTHLRIAVLCALLAAAIAAAEEDAGDGAEETPPPPWTLPPAGSCDPHGGLRGWPLGRDAPPVSFGPGDTITVDEARLLEDFLPPDVWSYRERFFYAGMRMTIGACFADYGPPQFHREATEKFAGKPRLDENGGLERYTAGTPFPPELIAPTDPEAGMKWAWNSALRYQGAGFRGRFRTSDMVGRDGRAEPFEGEFFKVLMSFRADRPRRYEMPQARDKWWVAGGQFSAPFPAREYTWRQYRSVEMLTDVGRSDDVHAYLPEWRRTRRVSAAGVEGLYMPSFSVGVSAPQMASTSGGGTDGASSSAAGGLMSPGATITTKRSGFEGLEIRPLLYHFRVRGVQDVLTPINASTPAYPADPDREFGPWGLSFASDTWDLRRAVVLEGRSKSPVDGGHVELITIYLDAQTFVPLYYVSNRYVITADQRREPIDVGMFVGRWSEDRLEYPGWPDDPMRPVRVIDPVGAAFANLSEDGGWRRESWEMVSTPPPDRAVKHEISLANLTRRR